MTQKKFDLEERFVTLATGMASFLSRCIQRFYPSILWKSIALLGVKNFLNLNLNFALEL